jgi:hypothetical protein
MVRRHWSFFSKQTEPYRREFEEQDTGERVLQCKELEAHRKRESSDWNQRKRALQNTINTGLCTKQNCSLDRDPGVCIAYWHWESSLFLLVFGYGAVAGSHFERFLSETATLKIKGHSIVLSSGTPSKCQVLIYWVLAYRVGLITGDNFWVRDSESSRGWETNWVTVGSGGHFWLGAIN